MSTELERVTLPIHVSPSHYSLELTPNLESLEFYCNEVIDVDVTKAGVSEVTLHSKEIFIETVSFKSVGTASAPTVVEINYNTQYNTVKFVFDGALPEGKGQIFIRFRGILNGDMCGFYKSSYADANGNKKIMASTQFEALDARRAFPCWDEPAVKATFTVSLIVPAHLMAISNMPETSTVHVPAPAAHHGTNGGKQLKKVTFEVTPKMSTYLLAWCVGEFDFVQGVTKGGVMIRVLSPPGRGPQGQFALDVGIRSLDFYDDFFKVPYPLPKLDMICITEFAAGAMENWGLVTYREVALMIDAETASPQQKQRVAIVVAHELAHQWFGNLVTMQWWEGLWLNEGFAAYMEHFCVDALFPEYKIWEQFTTDGYSAAQRLDALRSSHPVIVPIKHAEEVDQVFDAISYCKGSTVVRMVEAILGPEKFQEGLQVYMQKHAYGNTETVDLWNCWSEVSGQNVAHLMDTWTTVTGYPYLKVVSEKWSDDKVEITLQQDRFLSDGSASSAEEAGALWSIPLLFASTGSDSAQAVIMDQKQQTFSIPVQPGTEGQLPWIKINAGQKALVRVSHSLEMITRMRSAIHEVAPVDRAALLLDAYALAKAGLAPLETVVEILRALQSEETSIVWGAIAGVLGGLHLLMEQLGTESEKGAAAFKEFVAFGKATVLKALAKVGWDSKEGESHTDKLLRASVMELLDSFAFDDAAVAKEAKRRFDAHWTEPAVLPSEYKSTVYRIVLLNGGLAEYEAVLAEYRNTEDNQVRKYPMFTLGAVADLSLKQRTLDWALKSGEVKTQDTFYPIGSVASNAVGAEMTWKYFQENFALIKSMYAKASPSLLAAMVVSSIGRFCTTARADEVQAFFTQNPLPTVERRISQSLENMRANAAMLSAMGKSKLAEAAYWVV